jgi:hypothetical protein
MDLFGWSLRLIFLVNIPIGLTRSQGCRSKRRTVDGDDREVDWRHLLFVGQCRRGRDGLRRHRSPSPLRADNLSHRGNTAKSGDCTPTQQQRSAEDNGALDDGGQGCPE